MVYLVDNSELSPGSSRGSTRSVTMSPEIERVMRLTRSKIEPPKKLLEPLRVILKSPQTLSEPAPEILDLSLNKNKKNFSMDQLLKK